MPRVIFMGTPEFAVPSLRALIHAGYEIVAVVTQPDAPAGRGQTLCASPVKELALAHGLTVLQPETLKPPEVVQAFRDLAPEVIVVAAFGQILRPEVLAIPPRGCVNVHASLLPRWRGASPISAAIAAGDAVTGVTIMLMDAGLDSGPILSQRAEPIRLDDTTGSLSERLAELGAQALIETLPGWLSGAITPQPQDESQVTLAPRLKKTQGQIDWSRPAIEIERHVRAMLPWPSAFTFWEGHQLKVLRAAVHDDSMPPTLPSGSVLTFNREILIVQCGVGRLRLLEVQLEGKRPTSADAFLRGHPGFASAVLGSAPVPQND